MPRLVNHTSFAAAVFGALSPLARRYDIVVLSAAFEVLPGKPLRVADEQPSVRGVDHYFGEPGRSSIRYEGETAWGKPFLDVLVNGRAFAPSGRSAAAVMVALRIGDITKELVVSGDRHWQQGLLGATPSSPEAFETIPIVYERAFGGIDIRSSNPARHAAERRNLVGVGFQGALPSSPDIGTEVPNVEYPGQRMSSPRDCPEPAGFGVVGRDWLPRLAYGGTYDDAWMSEQSPLLPLDFDVRHFQAAPPDQQSRTIRGGEPVQILNMTPEGVWEFSLPTLDVPLRLSYRDRRRMGSLKLDTVLMEPDLYRITLIARAGIPLLRNRAPLEEVILGHVTPGWWRARVRNKEYLEYRGKNERALGTRDFIA
jgi:hypothetical protein